jgi:hypothetical protein
MGNSKITAISLNGSPRQFVPICGYAQALERKRKLIEEKVAPPYDSRRTWGKRISTASINESTSS